ncbi:hypothetical protein [Acinetobacter sp. ANC 3903]|uniref:hypothetical protein n=1 Tax=Acinetobacter sp. ANC 3903 TaxID=1977883 RepID=UPI001D173CB5|nr:hypothetical protein [Acinetobacter sp. ANC 3903]
MLPLTVLAGFFTDSTHSHSLKEVHELFANLFLASVLLHLAALTLNSVLLKNGWKKVCFGELNYIQSSSCLIQSCEWACWSLSGCGILAKLL